MEAVGRSNQRLTMPRFPKKGTDTVLRRWSTVRKMQPVTIFRKMVTGSIFALLGAAPAAAEELTPELELGRTLYLRYCAECHGDDGGGEGMRQDVSYARPRDFQSRIFKLSTTQNLVPSDDDLYRSIATGMPGSGMPNWGYLPEQEIRALVAWVRHFGHVALRERLDRQIADGELTEEQANVTFAELTTPGPPIDVPPEPSKSDAGLARGREVYLEACAPCHGANGVSVGDLKLDSRGNWLVPTSLAEGVFKGGTEGAQIYARLAKGMNGTAMPAYDQAYGGETLWRVVHYVQGIAAGEIVPDDAGTGPPAVTSSPAPADSPFDEIVEGPLPGAESERAITGETLVLLGLGVLGLLFLAALLLATIRR